MSVNEQIQQTGRKEKEEDPAFFIFEQFIVYAGCFLLGIKNLSEEEQANLIYAWTDYARAFDYKGRVSKRRAELAKNASITPWERPETDWKYYQNYIVPAFTKTFGRIATSAMSYIMSNDDSTMLLFNTNDPNLFVQETFGNREFRDLLKKSLQSEPLYGVSKTRQMEIEFKASQDFAEIEGGFFRRDKLVQIFHILRADTLQLYSLIDKAGSTKGRPLLISDTFGHFIALPPVTIGKEKEEADKGEEEAAAKEPISEAGSVPQEEEKTPPPLSDEGQGETPHEEPRSLDPSLILERHKRIIEFRERGKSYRQIARMVKISKSTVALELKHHRELRCGCENPKTEAQEKLASATTKVN
jgi:hypothetical protein